MKISEDLGLPAEAVYFQAFRIADGALIAYTPVTGTTDGHAFCYHWLNRCRAFGYLCAVESEEEYAMIDVYDENESQVAEYAVSKKGFEYLRSRLKLRWENREEWEACRDANSSAGKVQP